METAFFVVALALAPAGVAVARRQLRRAGHERYTSLALLDVAGLSAAVLVARAAAAVAGPTPSHGCCSSVRQRSSVSTSSPTGGHSCCPAHRRAPRARLRSWESAPSSPAPSRASTHGRCSPPSACGCACSSCRSSPRYGPSDSGSDAARMAPGDRRGRHGHDGPRRERRERLLERLPVRLRLLPRPRQRDAARPPAARRHVLPVRRRVVLRADRRVPRDTPQLRGSAVRPVRCLRGRVRPRVRRPAAGLPLATGGGARAGGGAGRESGGVPPVHRYSEHRAAALRVALGGDTRGDASGTLVRSSTPPRRGDARSPSASPQSGARRPSSTRLAAYAAITVFSIVDRPESPSERSLRVAKRIAAAVVVAFVAVGATSAFLLVVAGDWPRWTDYLGLVALYAMRGFGSLLIPTWSPGYLVGALYVVSLTALVALPRDVRRRLDPTIAATAGATAFGAIAFTYFLGRSAPSNLHHVAVPAVVVACGWWTVVVPHLRRLSRAYAWGAVLAASCVGASVLASSSNATGAWLGATTARPGRAVARGPRRRGSARSSPRRRTTPDRRGRAARPSVLDDGSSAGRPDQRRRSHGRAPRGASRERAPDRQRQPGGPGRRPALKRVVAATDRLPQGSFVVTETMFMRRPAQAFAQLDPIRNPFGSATISCRGPYEALAERFELRVASAAGSDTSCSSSGGAGDARSTLRSRERRHHARARGTSARSRRGYAASSSSSPCGRASATSARRSPSRTSSPRSTRTSSRRSTRATPTATGSCSRRATRASRSTPRSTSATG